MPPFRAAAEDTNETDRDDWRRGVADRGYCVRPDSAAGANPYTANVKAQAEQIRSLVLRTAEKVPEDVYAFKPTPDVRSLGGLLGHIADAHNLLCGMATGAKPAFNPVNEKKTTRADLVAALKESFAVCDKVFAETTDANGTTPVDMFGRRSPGWACWHSTTATRGSITAISSPTCG